MIMIMSFQCNAVITLQKANANVNIANKTYNNFREKNKWAC